MKVSFVTRMLTAALLCARTIGASPASNDSLCECLSVYEPVCCDGVQFPSICHAKCDGLPGELVAGCVSANCSQIDDDSSVNFETFSDGADDATRVMARRRLFRAWSRRYEGDTWFNEGDVIDWINSLNDDGLDSFLEALELDELAQSPNYAAHDVDYDYGYDAYAYYDEMMVLDDIFDTHKDDQDFVKKATADDALKAVKGINGNTIKTLVHATSERGFKGIKLGLNTMHMGQQWNMIGDGIYFAESVKAATSKAQGGAEYLIYARVRVGNSLEYAESRNEEDIKNSGLTLWSTGRNAFFWKNPQKPEKGQVNSKLDQGKLYLASLSKDSVRFVDCAGSYKGYGPNAAQPEWVILNPKQIYVVGKIPVKEDK